MHWPIHVPVGTNTLTECPILFGVSSYNNVLVHVATGPRV